MLIQSVEKRKENLEKYKKTGKTEVGCNTFDFFHHMLLPSAQFAC